MPTLLEKYFSQRIKNIFNHLYDFELKRDEVSLHDLRVELKKLRAIIKFLISIYPKQKLRKTAYLLRIIFQKAGEIREYQLLQQWLRKNQFFEIENEYFPEVGLQEMKMSFISHIDDYKNDLKEIVEHITGFILSTNEILTEQYFAELNVLVARKYRKNLPSTEWHEFRKLIKQRIYIYNWVLHAKEDTVFSNYNKLQETIGQWHDLETINEVFEQKQIYLSQVMKIQKDYALASEKLTVLIKQKEKQVEAILSKELVNNAT